MLLSLLLFACAPKSTTEDSAPDAVHPTVSESPSSSTPSSPDTTTTTPGSTAGFEAYLAELAGRVSQDELRSSVEVLEGFGTRFTGTEGNHQAHEWLTEQLEGLGFDVEQDHFVFGERHGGGTGAGDSTNLIARQAGAEEPDVVFIFSAHYDSTSPSPELLAPGADDNASGVAALLETARLLVDQPHRYSIWYVLTGAEEQGSRGSEHLVAALRADEVEVRGVIAPDMIGYWPLGDADAFDILGDTESEHLVNSMADVADLLGVAHKTWVEHGYCYGDDHTNFQESGFPAIAPMDCVEAHNLPMYGEATPHYHQLSDQVETLHMPFFTKVSSVHTATLSLWADPILE